MVAGYLYVLWHPTFEHYGPNVYKLGMTNNPSRRLQGYSPGFLDAVKYLYVSKEFANCHEAEKVLFFALKKERLKSHREFFQLPLELAKTTIENLERLSAEEVHSLYVRARNDLVPQSVCVRLRADSEEVTKYNQEWTTKYSGGEPVDKFLDKFKFTAR